MTILIEELWRALEAGGEAGGARRVDDRHPSDLYAALDTQSHPGLVLITATAPPEAPVFEAVEVTVTRRNDGRHALGLWLRAGALRGLFERLCQDLVEASRNLPPAAVANFVVTRLLRWRRLLEAGADGVLQSTELRGLLGELLVLRECLTEWPAAEVVAGWIGPLDAPQDFALPSARLEVKTIRPGGSTARISSADQLDVHDADLFLVIATLARAAEGEGSFTAAGLVNELRSRLAASAPPATVADFESLLAAGGYADHPHYEQSRFRLDAIRTFAVTDGFPRLRRSDLPVGLSEVTYDIELSACGPFAAQLPGPSHGA
jgi:hypothetical protein